MNDTVVSAPEVESTGIAEYTQTEHGLADLRSRLHGRVYDVATTKGMTEARQSRAELRSLRVNLDKLRKQLNEDDQARITMRNGKAKEITAKIVALEDPIDSQIKQEEARKEEARIERERAEAERLRRINEEISNIERMPLDHLNATADELRAGIEKLVADELQDFDEVHLPTAQAAKDSALTKLRDMLAAREAAEAEAEQLVAQRAELERLQQEQAKRDAEAAAQREREDSERRRLQDEEDRKRAEQAAAAKAEQERISSEQADRQRLLDEQAAEQHQQQAEAERAAREQQEREEAERQEAEVASQAKAEALAIERATLRKASAEAVDLLIDLGQEQHLTTRKLIAALAKEPKA